MRNDVSLRTVLYGTLVLSLLNLEAALVRADDKKPENTAIKPVPKDVKRHEAFVAIAKRGGVDVLFLGDSITDAWGGEGHRANAPGTEVLVREFGSLKLANFGISGDRTQHVLWRLQNGELDGIQPKLVMLMIGTNNSNGKDNTAEEIAEGITTIVKEIHQRSPKTKVLLLAVFPRREKPEDPQREKLKQVNAIIGKLDDGGKTVKYLDIGDRFLDKDGKLPKDVMPDFLHPNAKGYEIWAKAVKGPIQELLGNK
jgi:lysophospholipase L1-like esterase